jgi:hypothetical protein
VVVVSPFATLADPAADIADRELGYSNQPSKLEHPSSPSSMAPLPASSARMALRQTPHASSARLSQVQRHFSTTSPVRKEIQDAYILSAARTPTGKVRTASQVSTLNTKTRSTDSLMAPSSQSLPPNSVPLQSKQPLRNPMSRPRKSATYTSATYYKLALGKRQLDRQPYLLA